MKPIDLLREAQAIRKKREPRYYCASEYFDVIKILREEKTLTWHEIGDFFRSKGINLCDISLSNAYKKENRRREEIHENVRETLKQIPSPII